MVHPKINELAQICLQHGISHAVISPGSRNAPLIIAFAKNPEFECLSIADERSAAYFALGMARRLQKTVVLICTSGTAALNYTPALAEARYQKVPLLALTADRPPEWIDQNDGQSIRQQHIYDSFIKRSFSLPVFTGHDEETWHIRRIMSEAINLTTTGGHGPVHVNIPLREPLYTPQPVIKDPLPSLAVPTAVIMPGEEQWESIAREWSSAAKRLIVCGPMNRDEELNRLLCRISVDDEAAVIAENLSNLCNTEFIDTPESFLARLSEQELKDFTPDLLLTVGGGVVSKGLKNYLRKYKPSQHWHIDEEDLFIDTFRHLAQNIRVSPRRFFSRMAGTGKNDKDYMRLVREKPVGCRILHHEFMQKAGFSDLVAYQCVFNYLPPGCNLHLANSTPVRYAQLFSTQPDVTYNSNRGVSGIDGCLSAAAGAAHVNEGQTILLSGDIAFIYDSNGLWNDHISKDLRIIVFNNDGGNIFKLIKTGGEIKGIEHFFETPHRVDLKALSGAFGADHYLACDRDELEHALQHFFKPKERVAVLEIKTSGIESARVFKQYFQHLSQKDEQ